MTPEYKLAERGIVIKKVENPKPISEFPEADRRDMCFRYTVKQMIREGYDDMSFVELNTVITYELVPGDGFDNLYDAYVDWWESTMSYIVHKVPTKLETQSFYPINPTEDKIEKEKTMIYTVNEKEIRRVIRCTKDRIICACNQLDSMSFEPGDKCQNSLQIVTEIKQIANDIERAVNHLKFLSELQGASSIQMNEQEYARFYMDLSAE